MRVIFLQGSISLREKYPNHHLWKHPLFSSLEYASFKKEVTTTAATMVTPALHTLDSVVPQLAAVLMENFEALSGKIDALAAGVGSIKDFSKKKRLVVRLEDIEGGDTSDIDVCTHTQPSNSAKPSGETTSTTVKLSRSVRTVIDLWREYTDGVGGQMSIAEADKLLGTKWRQNPTESRFYLRRKRYYDAVSTIAARDSITRENAAEKLELELSKLSLLLNAFTKRLPELTR
ncbi:hypothetical protein PHMEG_00037069 [Phytophthora megakarya]|uniref:Transcription activator GCR1-like domain-containing protein n=1 Tax=Phytophthora megakarya TaxID=4795 RepID=A0A225UK58_9STRA|nr:hypothetical protein PHMEG_00037069 [Phytophthora megakarya]